MKKGFTLIELLVAMGIFVTITAMVVANFRVGGRAEELRIAAETLVSHLRRTQNMALAGQIVNGVSPPGGYGLYFNKSLNSDRYIIFADQDGGNDYDLGEALVDGIIILPRDIRITNLETAPTGPALTATVNFKPPKPIIYINSGTSETTLFITLKHTLNERTRKVFVKRISGQIGIE